MNRRTPRPSRRLWLIWATLGVVGCALTAPNATAESAVLQSGRFEGRNRHLTHGGVTVLKTDTGIVLVLEPDFTFDGAPDPKLAFGNDGYDRKTLFAELRRNGGAQIYTVPKRIDPTAYDELWIWCEKFNVALGVAPLVAPTPTEADPTPPPEAPAPD